MSVASAVHVKNVVAVKIAVHATVVTAQRATVAAWFAARGSA